MAAFNSRMRHAAEYGTQGRVDDLQGRSRALAHLPRRFRPVNRDHAGRNFRATPPDQNLESYHLFKSVPSAVPCVSCVPLAPFITRCGTAVSDGPAGHPCWPRWRLSGSLPACFLLIGMVVVAVGAGTNGLRMGRGVVTHATVMVTCGVSIHVRNRNHRTAASLMSRIPVDSLGLAVNLRTVEAC